MGSMTTDLPYVDTHRTTVAASRSQTWIALRQYADSLGIGARNPLGLILATRPHSGFEIAQEVPDRELGLTGRHRFARYLLVFEIADLAEGKSLLSAHTYSEFPGAAGRAYRALVISTGLHGVATRSMLRSIERLSAH